MQVLAYKRFTKRINSTKRPDPTEGGDAHDILWVFLKKDCSLQNPIFELTITDQLNHPEFSYTYLEFNNRYYYVTDCIVQNSKICEIHCKHDPLATFRWYIEHTSAYVEYCADDRYYNASIPDTRMTMTTNVIKGSSSAQVLSNSAGSYILNVAGNSYSAQFGLTNFWEVSTYSLYQLANWLYNENILDQDYWKKLWQAPYDSLIECHWVPWTVSGNGGNIHIGEKDSGISADGLGYPTYGLSTNTISLNIPSLYGDWRDYEPYSTLTLYLPFVGTSTIDRNKIKGESTMDIVVLKDACGGEIFYFISCGNYKQIASASVGVNVPVGQTTDNKVGGIGKVLGGAAAVAGGLAATVGTGGLAAPAAAAMVGGVTAIGSGYMDYFSTESSGAGSVSGLASGVGTVATASSYGSQYARLTQYAHTFATYPTSMRYIAGLPCFSVQTLGDLYHGYVKCSGASVSLEGYEGDKAVINTALNNGIYIE